MSSADRSQQPLLSYRLQHHCQTANSKRPSIKPTTPSKHHPTENEANYRCNVKTARVALRIRALYFQGFTNFISVPHRTVTILLSHEDRPSQIPPKGVPRPMDNHTLTHQIRGGRTNSLNRRMLST